RQRSLQDHFLIAMPAMADPNFSETVTYICKHDADGAFGVIVNRPGDLSLAEVLRQLAIPLTDRTRLDSPVLRGGPLDPERGFAPPLTTLRVDRDPPWAELDRIVVDWKPTQFVVGVPEGEGAAAVARRARQFAVASGSRYSLPVATVDETFTSVEAEATLAANRRSGYLRRRVGKG